MFIRYWSIVRRATNPSVHFIAKSEAKDHLVDNLNRMPSKIRHLRRLFVACFRRFNSGTCKFFFFYSCGFETFVTIFFMLCWLLTLRWIQNAQLIKSVHSNLKGSFLSKPVPTNWERVLIYSFVRLKILFPRKFGVSNLAAKIAGLICLATCFPFFQ